jgi:hypothetical protein
MTTTTATTPLVQASVAIAVLGLRQLLRAICAARPDGDELLALCARSHVRIVIDEELGLLEFIKIGADGEPDGSLDAVILSHAHGNFGALMSLSQFENLTVQ